MSMVDSSVLVAVLAPEADGEAFAMQIQEASAPITSPLAMFETVLALCRLRQASVADMAAVVSEFLARAGARIVPMDADLHVAALQAHERYGKGTGHPARLNMGDCFSYAMARRAGVPLLYKGEDFALTDLA